MISRREKLLSLVPSNGLGLEIGPSYNPLLPKSAGYNIETLDYTDRTGLLTKYAKTENVDLSAIEEVDYVSSGGSMVDCIGASSRYDFIIASHVIEHTPDLLGFLLDCEALLKPQGVLVLAVPDKRYCFDHLQPLTSVGHILEAHRESRTRPTPGAVFDSIAYDVLRDGKIGWPPNDSGTLEFNGSLENAVELSDRAASSTEYIDVHVWRFVPSSFRLIIHDLHAIGKSRLREAKFLEGAGHEFYISLSADAFGPQTSRISLARAIDDEIAAGISPELKVRVLKLETSISELAAEIETKDTRLAKLSELSNNLEAKIAELSEILSKTKHELSLSEAEREALVSSRSWKVTSPLRAIRRLTGRS